MVVVQQEGKRGREEIVARTTQIAEATTTWRPIEVRWQKVRTRKTERERVSESEVASVKMEGKMGNLSQLQ